MSDEIRAEIKTAAKALCHYQSGPSDVNSCCPGIGRCEMDAAIGEIARLRAACDASEERERAIELRFWQTVDRDGLTGLPSDMWAALEQLTQDRAALATALREGMEEAAKIAESCAADWAKSAIGKYINSKWDFQSRAEAGEEIAAAIGAAAKERKP